MFFSQKKNNMPLGLLVLVCCFVLSCAEEQSTASSGGEPASTVPVALNNTPIVPILDYNGLEPLMQKDNDTTYVVNFWATWCKPCVEELPYFEQVTEMYRDQKVKVLLVSLDFKKQIETKLLPFIAKHKLQSDVVVLYDNDADTWIPKVSPDWSGAIPATVVYRGSERQFYEKSFHNFSELNDIVKTFLN
jgi:thiol-disulfide isomerase/thioredoxin